MTTHDPIAVPVGPAQAIRHDNLLISFTTEFLRIWDTAGSRAKPGAFWRPTPAADVLPGYFPLGDVANDGHANISGRHVVAVVCEAETASADPAKGKALRRPEDYELIWKDSGSGAKRNGAIWRPVPPAGYVALGSVCSDGHEKPSLNAVRCVRMDLVSASGLAEPVWNDKGSGARQSISTWSAVPPAASSDEIHLAPGTFVGCSGYARAAELTVYSLCMPISLQAGPRPVAPVLDSDTPATVQASEQPAYTARLPWFTVKDPQLAPPQQLLQSPYYLLQRTDHYQLVGHCHNSENDSRTFRWTAPRAQQSESLRTFTDTTSIEFGVQWQKNLPRPFLFSARLNNGFSQCEFHSNEWRNPAPIDVAAVIAGNRSVAVYLLQSDYSLLRADGTRVTSDISYTDSNSLHFSEYMAPQPDSIIPRQEQPQRQDDIGTSAAQSEIANEPAQASLPAVTDNAP